MLLYVAATLSAAAVLFLATAPVFGVALLFIAKPIVDTLFAQPILFGFPLGYIVGGLVPVIILGHLLFARREQAFHRMPLRFIWSLYAIDIFFFSLFISYHQNIMSGVNVFFRHINGFVGFYMLQAFFHQGKGKELKMLLLALIIAGFFPMGVGIYQLVTKTVWISAQAEGVSRFVGLYHDAFTVRAYAFQTILALLLYSALYSRNFLIKAVTLAYGGISIVVLIKAYSKAGILSLLIWAASWTMLQRKFISLLLLGTAGALIGAYYASDILDNIMQLFHKEIGAFEGTVETSRTFSGRWLGWAEMMSRWWKFHWVSKLFGSGLVATGSHNDYLQILFHGGLVGLGIYIALLAAVGARVVSNLRRDIDPLSVAALMLFTMWMVDTIGLVPSAYPGYQWFVWGLIGLSFRLRSMEAEAARENIRLKTVEKLKVGPALPRRTTIKIPAS